jgi:heme/copper-type cytochrome/quinol oxidase subunit 2
MWSIIPFFISMVIFVWAASVFFDYVRPPDQTLQVYSTGKRWMWRFQHVNGQSEINELHVPLGRPVKITFTSEDVLHSLFIPAFRVKADAIPGRYSSIWFTPTKAGEFHLFCAEYCGTQHSGMVGRVVVMEPADYQAWLAGGGRPRPWPRAASSCSPISAATPATSRTAPAAAPRSTASSGARACSPPARPSARTTPTSASRS